MKLKMIAALAAAGLGIGLGIYLIGRKNRKSPGKIIATQGNRHHLTDVFAKAKTHPV